MGQGVQYCAAMTAAIASTAFGPAAHGTEINDILGRWGDAQKMYDCSAEDGTETQPVSIEASESGYFIGGYVWGCTVPAWEKRGAFLTAAASCGSEGEDMTTREMIEVAKTSADQLVLVRDNDVTVLTACKAAE